MKSHEKYVTLKDKYSDFLELSPSINKGLGVKLTRIDVEEQKMRKQGKPGIGIYIGYVAYVMAIRIICLVARLYKSMFGMKN